MAILFPSPPKQAPSIDLFCGLCSEQSDDRSFLKVPRRRSALSAGIQDAVSKGPLSPRHATSPFPPKAFQLISRSLLK